MIPLRLKKRNKLEDILKKKNQMNFNRDGVLHIGPNTLTYKLYTQIHIIREKG